VLSGGGRYDGLAEELGGGPTPGVGFGAGIERLLLALEHAGSTAPGDDGIDVFFLLEEGGDRATMLAEMMKLREKGLRCDADYAGRSVKGQLTQAGRLGAKHVIRVGPETDLAAEVAKL
jgi:histidyl-tRNA synthetase